MSTINKKEIEKFSNLASEWWNPNGKFAPLHKFNPVRIEYIKDELIAHFKLDRKKPEPLKDINILDIGCGVGTNVKKLLDKGYKVDGLVPYPWMAKYASNIISNYKSQDRGRIYKCKIEDFPIKEIERKYQLVFFSESFQYVNMNLTFNILEKILKKHSTIIIFDFFKKDNIEELSPLGGGHSINLFYNVIKNFNYKIKEDIDITDNLSPNLKIINEIMVERLIPFSDTFDKFMLTRHKSIYRIIKWLLRKKINKIKFKYSNRDENNFKKFKTYRLIVLKKDI